MSNFSHKMEYLCCCSWSFHMGDEDDLHVTAKSWLLLLTLQTSLSLSLGNIDHHYWTGNMHGKPLKISRNKKTNWKIKKSIYYKTAIRKETDYDEFDDCLVSHTQLFGKIKKKGLSSHLVFLQTMSCFLNSRSQWHQGIHGIQGSMRICEFFQCQGKQEFLV